MILCFNLLVKYQLKFQSPIFISILLSIHHISYLFNLFYFTFILIFMLAISFLKHIKVFLTSIFIPFTLILLLIWISKSMSNQFVFDGSISLFFYQYRQVFLYGLCFIEKPKYLFIFFPFFKQTNWTPLNYLPHGLAFFNLKIYKLSHSLKLFIPIIKPMV